MNHIISECSKLAQVDYKYRHDIEVMPKWYEHHPQAEKENERCKILWDFNIQTDYVIEAGRPDMIIR